MILVFDTETTGIRQGDFVPRIVQLAALLADDEGHPVAELNVVIYPDGWKIPVEAARVHGITTEFATKHGVLMLDAFRIFFGMMRSADYLVAHNIGFDLDLLQIELARLEDIGYTAASEKWSKRLESTVRFDTMAAARNVVKMPFTEKQVALFMRFPDKQDGDFKAPNLTECYQHFFGTGFDGAHDAMADVRACRDVYLKLQGNFQSE